MTLWFQGRVIEVDDVAGGPPPDVGTDIYLQSALYISHGEDDFAGGLCRVTRVTVGMSAGNPTWFVEVAECPGRSLNWAMLGPKQATLLAKFGAQRGHADPDEISDYDDTPWS